MRAAVLVFLLAGCTQWADGVTPADAQADGDRTSLDMSRATDMASTKDMLASEIDLKQPAPDMAKAPADMATASDLACFASTGFSCSAPSDCCPVAIDPPNYGEYQTCNVSCCSVWCDYSSGQVVTDCGNHETFSTASWCHH